MTKAQRGQEAASVCPVCPALSLAAHLGPFLAPVVSLVSVYLHGACMARGCPVSPSLGGVQGQGPGSEAPLSIHPPVCLDDTFGPDCSLTCDDCRNGGTCLPSLDGCDCPDGWTGLICNESEAAVGVGPLGGQGPGAPGPARHGQSTPPTVLGRSFPGPAIHSFLQGLPAAFSTPGSLPGAVRPWGLAEPGICLSQISRVDEGPATSKPTAN